jgi:O-antigen/teichoic acid export membrane protein
MSSQEFPPSLQAPPSSANQRLGARVFSNASILVGVQVISKLLGTVLVIVAARLLGVADYGLYTFATTFGLIFGLLAAFGFAQLVAREVARDLSRTGQTLGSILVLEAVLTVVAALAMMVTLRVLHYPADRLWIVVIIGLSMVLNSVLNVITAFFRAHQRMELEAVTRIVFSVFNLVLGLAVLLAGYGIVPLALAQLAVFVVVLALSVFLAVRVLARPQFSRSWPAYRQLLVAGRPFALSSIFIFIYDGTAIIFLSLFQGDQVTGLYAGAMNFVFLFGILPASLVGAVLPALSQLWPGSPVSWLALYRYTIKYLLLMALPIAAGLALVSDEIVPLVLGPAYSSAASILHLAAWLLILVFLNHGLSTALISVDQEKTYLRIVGLALIVNLIANLLLIPAWAAYGAVAASLLTEGLIMAMLIVVLSKAGLHTRLVRLSLKPWACVAIMAATVYLVRELGLAVEILVGSMVYIGALLLLRVFEADEIEQARLFRQAAAKRLRGWRDRHARWRQAQKAQVR